MHESSRFQPEEWASRLGDFDMKIARKALICKLPLLSPGRILRAGQSAMRLRLRVAHGGVTRRRRGPAGRRDSWSAPWHPRRRG